jgi:tripartite-type tricarboxylate transporter receptor subunit TctC
LAPEGEKEIMKLFGHEASFAIAALIMLAWLTDSSSAVENVAVSFAGKTITIIIGSETGGTTDASARLMGTFLSKYLPGKPSVIVQSRPGAHSLKAMSYFAQQVKPDGLTTAVASVNQLDPESYRVPQSRYDPTTFAMIGGIDLGGGIMIIRADAFPRLTDRKAQPVVMGSSTGLPHGTMLMTAWGIDYLDWNVQWVSGYPSPTSALALALERGEIDMTGFSTSGLTDSLLDRSKYKIIYQTGTGTCTVPSELRVIADVPLFSAAVKGKIADPLARQAFDYWCHAGSTLVWMALPPRTSEAVIDTYRAAFGRVTADPAFLEQGRRFSQDVSSVAHESVTATVRSFAQVSPEVVSFMPQMLRRQGLTVN